jgi:hypothetical protein
MSSTEEETQCIQASCTLEQFTKIFVKNYPLIFKNGSYSAKLFPDMDGKFPYEVILEIRVKQ